MSRQLTEGRLSVKAVKAWEATDKEERVQLLGPRANGSLGIESCKFVVSTLKVVDGLLIRATYPLRENVISKHAFQYSGSSDQSKTCTQHPTRDTQSGARLPYSGRSIQRINSVSSFRCRTTLYQTRD